MNLSPAHLQQLIDTTLPAIPEDDTSHVVVGTVDASGVQVVVGFRFHGNQWEVQSKAHYDWAGHGDASATIIARW